MSWHEWFYFDADCTLVLHDHRVACCKSRPCTGIRCVYRNNHTEDQIVYSTLCPNVRIGFSDVLQYRAPIFKYATPGWSQKFTEDAVERSLLGVQANAKIAPIIQTYLLVWQLTGRDVIRFLKDAVLPENIDRERVLKRMGLRAALLHEPYRCSVSLLERLMRFEFEAYNVGLAQPKGLASDTLELAFRGKL